MISYLRHTPADVLFTWLVNELLVEDPSVDPGLGLWPCYVNFLPDTPDDVVVLTDVGGQLDGRGMSSFKTYKHPGVQIVVRGHRNNEPGAVETISLLDEALDTLHNVLVLKDDDDRVYKLHSVSKTSTIVAMGRSTETDRPHFSLNILVDFSLVP